MTRIRQYLVAGCMAICAALSMVAASGEAVQQPERSFGYSIGDVLVQRIQLDKSVERNQWDKLIPLERVDNWLERQSVTQVADDQWLEIQYQIVNAPSSVTTVQLPAISIATGESTSINIDNWPFTIAPLIPESTRESVDLPMLQADWEPHLTNVASAQRSLQILLILLGSTLTAWLIWWRWQNHYDAIHLPFAHARQQLSRLDPESINDTRDAWVELHRAFNRTAGRTVNSHSVDKLLLDANWLKPLQQPIEAFFAESAARFFEQSNHSAQIDLIQLGKTLHKAEKTHQSRLEPRSFKL